MQISSPSDECLWGMFETNISKYKCFCKPIRAALLSKGRTVFGRTLGSWVRIKLKTWMTMCIYPLFVLFCVYVATLRRADHSSKELYRLCTGLRN
jgi:hypothetical protein